MIKRSRVSGITSAFAADTDKAEPTARSEGINQITFSHLDKVEVGESIEYEVTDSNGEPDAIFNSAYAARSDPHCGHSPRCQSDTA